MSDESSPLIAFVALNADIPLNAASILDSLQGFAPGANVEEVTESEENPSSFTFQLNGNMGAVSLMPGPLPWEDLEGPCETAWWWPDAADAMRDHSVHVLVALMGESGSVAERHVLLSALVASVVENSHSAGVYWGGGTLVHEPEEFVTQVRELSTENMLPHLWIDMRLAQNEDESLSFFTTGMIHFNKLEIEIDRATLDPEELLNFCYGIIDYIVTSDVDINHGETIGRTEDEKLAVTHEPSMLHNREDTVMKLTFP